MLISSLTVMLSRIAPGVGAWIDPPEVGKPAPDFKLSNDEGKMVSLKVKPMPHREEPLSALAELQKK